MVGMVLALVTCSRLAVAGIAVTPFMVIPDTVQAAMVAGVFSVINMGLNIVLVRMLRPERELMEETHGAVQETKKIVDRRAQERDL